MKRIKLSQGKFALIDDEDFYRVSKHKWSAGKYARDTWYAKTMINGKFVQMHRFILNPSDDQLTDHKNHNGLDNRRRNIRVCETWQNQANRIKRSKASSRFKGVHWQTARKVWIAKIKRNGIAKHLGNFHDEIEAAIAYNKAAIIIFGDFAYLNIIPRRT